jgi:hypothetical protein
MTTTPLAAPTGVTSSLSGTTLTVKWTDPNPNGLVSNYTVTFNGRSGQGTYTPTPTTATIAANQPPQLAISTQAAGAPTLSDLAGNYAASVVANPANTATYAASPPGLQIYWIAGLSLEFSVGSHKFTLNQNSFSGGIYRLPVTPAAPWTVSIGDIQQFAVQMGIPAADVPTHWPDGTLINTNDALNIETLAIDTNTGLFALDISFTMNYSPFAGLTFNSVGLSVQRTDGVTVL